MQTVITWRPIEEADKDQTLLYLAVPSFPKPIMGNYRENENYMGTKRTGWFSLLGSAVHPTHFAEIPQLPEEIRALDTSCPACTSESS